MNEAESNILQAVAKEYGVTVDDIMSNSRRSDIAEARQMSMCLFAETSGYEPERIGRVFGRNRTTVIYAICKVRDLASVDKRTQRHLANLHGALGLAMSAK